VGIQGLWPTLLDFFANGVGTLEEIEGLSPEAEQLADQLDKHIVQLKMRLEMPDPDRISKFWDHLGSLWGLFTSRLRGGRPGKDGPAGDGRGESRDSLSSSSSGVPHLRASGDQGSTEAALREENRVLRAELLREREERQKLRNYIRAHSPHFGVSSREPTPGSVEPPSAPGDA